MSAQTVACRWVRDWTPTVDCGSTRWYRRLIAQTYDGSARRGRGRPMTRRDVAALVVRMAVEHPQWGDTRIRGALSNLGP